MGEPEGSCCVATTARPVGGPLCSKLRPAEEYRIRERDVAPASQEPACWACCFTGEAARRGEDNAEVDVPRPIAQLCALPVWLLAAPGPGFAARDIGKLGRGFTRTWRLAVLPGGAAADAEAEGAMAEEEEGMLGFLGKALPCAAGPAGVTGPAAPEADDMSVPGVWGGAVKEGLL